MSTFLKHTAQEFKANEFNTLSFIVEKGFFYGDFSELAAAIYSSYSKYFKKVIDNFSFVADFNMTIESKEHRVVIHADVEGDFDLTSYSLGICSLKKPTELIRRFHFDYDHKTLREKQKAFVSHLQYGGLAGNGSSGTQFSVAKIEHWLSEPRLNFPPMNLALLLDLIFCEFPTPATEIITEDSDWRTLVRHNEEFVLKQYFKIIADHIGSPRHTKQKLVRDICYP